MLAGNEPASRPGDGWTVEDVAFVSALDGSTQRYVLMLPKGFAAAEEHDVLIALHGHGSDRWQFAKDPRDECLAARDAVRSGAVQVTALTSRVDLRARFRRAGFVAGVPARFCWRSDHRALMDLLGSAPAHWVLGDSDNDEP